ncbi:phosphoribosyltransferase (plasmid) [Rhizobium ruizarguesonis]|uniref:phosphoribosyltransferase n=1 Tax=Rhizobium ruizarguesonis TaxID=2081791 RepID=UPI001031DF57|nr:phosphoribosyltransferase [Rhizobium ruizarguesonis]TBB58961.1 phosphoribosyltransferase [Rhizobium ruizarguesonis]
MEFPHLSLNTGLTRTYTLAYKLTDRNSETWSTRFSRFKDKDQKAYFGGARLFYEAFPPLFNSLNLAPANCVFLAALSSSETSADRSRQIPYIAAELANLIGAHDGIDALSKQVHESIHNRYSAGARDAELEKANYVCGKLPAKNVFVFDDFVTRGGTLSKVAQAVHAANSGSKVYGVALAKTERVNWCRNPENDHVPARWAKVWTDGENEVA